MKHLTLVAFLLSSLAYAGLDSHPVVFFGNAAKVIAPGGLTAGLINTPIAQTLYVTKAGIDSAACGPAGNPCLTIQQAEFSISDASISKKYAISVGPGSYAEGNSTLFRDNIFIVGAGQALTVITGNATYTMGNTVSAGGNILESGIYSAKMTGSLTITRSTSGFARTAQAAFTIFDCTMGAVTYTGAGIVPALTPDNLIVWNSNLGNLVVHGRNSGFAKNVFMLAPTVDNTSAYSVGSFTSSFTTAPGSGTTVTTTPGANYPADGTITGTLGGGGIEVFASTGIATNNSKAIFTYTAYDSTTGIFSGVVYAVGNAASVLSGDYLTSQGGATYTFVDVRHSAAMSVTANASTFNVSSVTARGLHGIGGPVALSGAAAKISVDADSVTNNVSPSLSNGALVSNFLRVSAGESLGYAPQRSTDWNTSSVVATGTATSGSATLSALSSTAGIFIGATASGTGIPTNATVKSITASTVVMTVASTATSAGQSITFQNVVPNSAQQAFDDLALGKANLSGAAFTGSVSAPNLSGTNTGDVTLAPVDSAPNANGASLSGQVLTLQPANASFPGVLLAADWNTFNSKEPAIASGTTSKYWRGDKSFQTLDTSVVPENGNLYFTNARVLSALPTGIGKKFVDKGGADSGTCGETKNPCLTIQQALTNIGDSASAADVKQPWTVIISPGVYDEDLTIPNGRILTLYSLGTVVLGNGSGSNWASTNSRSITYTINAANLFGSDIKPALNISASPYGDSTSTFIAESGSFYISGNLNVTGDGTTNTLSMDSVKLAGNLVHTTAALTNWQMHRSLIAGTVTTTGNLVLERAYDSRFNGLVSVNAYNMAFNCNFAGGMTVQSIQQNLLPNGMFSSNFAGTFTGPANSLRLDLTTDNYFRGNSASLAGGATKTLLAPVSSSSISGILSSTDWSTFNSKQGTGYTPATSANWGGAVPTTILSALDDLAAGTATPPQWLVGIGAAAASNAVLIFKDGHIKSTQTTAPTATVEASAGTGATCSVTNATDSAGVVTIVTGTIGLSTGSYCAVNFNKSYGVAPICSLTPASSTLSTSVYVTSTTAEVDVNFAVAGGISNTYVMNYSCIETQ